MRSISTKVCILGAGPAGTAASISLSQSGIPHIMVDKADFPRDKVCGESFDGRVYRLLETLCPGAVSELRQDEQLMATWNYCFRTKEVDLSVAFPKSELPRLSMAREQLDHYLFRQAHSYPQATIFTDTMIDQIEKQPQRVCLRSKELEISADLVIVANGAQILPAQKRASFVR